MRTPYDILILGGGPGGYVAALYAARCGARVGLIDEGGLGGTCLHRGCIPSKAWNATAELALKIRHAERLGLKVGAATVDWPAQVKRTHGIVKRLSQGLAELMRGSQVDVIAGPGKIGSPRTVSVNQTDYEGKALIVATGTEPASLPALPVNGRTIITTDHLFQIESLPRSLLIVGGGVTGCELASLFSALGVRVTLVEKMAEILPAEEPFVQRALKRALTNRGVQVQTNTDIQSIPREFDRILVAVGRRIGLRDIGFDRIGLKREGGFIVVDGHLETNVPGVYAIGDCTGVTMLAHGASAEGKVAVDAIMGRPSQIDYTRIPYGIFTIPEIAGIGFKERALQEKGVQYSVGRFSYGASGKALCDDEGEGMVQVFADASSGKILGASIVGAHATEMMAEIALAIKHDLPVTAIGEMIHSHPTYSEMVKEACDDTLGMALHKAGRPPGRR